MAIYRRRAALALCFAMSDVPGQTTTAVGAARRHAPVDQRRRAADASAFVGPDQQALEAMMGSPSAEAA